MLCKTTNNVYFLIDEGDAERVLKHRWTANPKGYIIARINRRCMNIARFLLDCPLGMETDHIDHNPLNNRRNNIRICTHQENQRNKNPTQNKTSQFKGVHWDKKSMKWRVSCKFNGSQMYLGLFAKEIDAAKKYNEFATKNYGAYACINEISEE